MGTATIHLKIAIVLTQSVWQSSMVPVLLCACICNIRIPSFSWVMTGTIRFLCWHTQKKDKPSWSWLAATKERRERETERHCISTQGISNLNNFWLTLILGITNGIGIVSTNKGYRTKASLAEFSMTVACCGATMDFWVWMSWYSEHREHWGDENEKWVLQ